MDIVWIAGKVSWHKNVVYVFITRYVNETIPIPNSNLVTSSPSPFFFLSRSCFHLKSSLDKLIFRWRGKHFETSCQPTVLGTCFDLVLSLLLLLFGFQSFKKEDRKKISLRFESGFERCWTKLLSIINDIECLRFLENFYNAMECSFERNKNPLIDLIF